MPKVPLMTARASTLPVAILLAVLGLLSEASSADTPCLIGMDATGLELGNRQLSVALKNANAEIDSAGVQCEPASGFLDPGIADASTGQAAYAAGSEGFSARSSALAAGESSGTVRVAVQGSVSILVRVESDPAYSGPTTIDIDVPVLVDVSGDGTASGTGSQFGGVYDTELSLKEVGAALAIPLDRAQGALATAEPMLLTSTVAIDIDTNYVFQIVHTQQVSAGAGPAPTGGIGSAQSSGTALISFDIMIAEGFEDPNLTPVFPMVDLLGVPAPGVGFPPTLPTPEPGAVLQGVSALATLVMLAKRRRRRSGSYQSTS